MVTRSVKGHRSSYERPSTELSLRTRYGVKFREARKAVRSRRQGCKQHACEHMRVVKWARDRKIGQYPLLVTSQNLLVLNKSLQSVLHVRYLGTTEGCEE